MTNENEQDTNTPSNKPGDNGDTIKSSVDDVPKTWDDIFKHSRFTSLIATKNEQAAQLDVLNKQLADAEEAKLKENEDFKALAEKHKADLDALKLEAETSRLESLRLRIAAETGINPELASRLQGDSEDDIRKDAETMLQYTQVTAPGAGIPNQQPGQPVPNASPSLSDMTPAEIVAMTPEQKLAIISGAA